MKNIKSTILFSISVIIFSLFLLNTFSKAYAQETPPRLDYSGLVKCDGVVNDEKNADGTLKEPYRQTLCNFATLIDTITKLINWLFLITVPIVTVLFAYAGLLYLTGSQPNIGKAKAIFLSVAKGFIIMLIAWLAVYTVVNWLVAPYFKDAATALIEQKK